MIFAVAGTRCGIISVKFVVFSKHRIFPSLNLETDMNHKNAQEPSTSHSEKTVQYGSFVTARPDSAGRAEPHAHSRNAKKRAAQRSAKKAGKVRASKKPESAKKAEQSEIKRLREELKAERKEMKRQERLHKKEVARKKRIARNRSRVRFSIGAKLILIMSTVVLVSLGGITYLVSYFITQDVRTSAEENNLTINSRAASETQTSISNAFSAVQMFLDFVNSAGGNETEIKSIESIFFTRNESIAAVYLAGQNRVFANSVFFISREIEKDKAEAWFLQESETVQAAAGGSTELENATPFFNVPMLCISAPVLAGSRRDAVSVLYSAEGLCESYSVGSVNMSFFINNSGRILVHSDFERMKNGDDDSQNPIVKAMNASSLNNSQITYKDADGKEFIGAYRRLGIGNGAVITTVETAVVLEGIQATTRRNIYITVAILAIAIMIIYFFSKSLSVPLKILTAIINEINKGNVNTELFKELRFHRKDEIGVLAKSTRHEREILNMFSKLTNKGVTRAIIRKKIDFEPHLKDITIFFSDIRGFTAISDGFKQRFGERSAGEIIGFLNDYMSRMVTCITRTGGIVDKFEGDAIMAAWGVLRRDGLDWESLPPTSVTRALKKDAHDAYVEEDALNAITACMGMRYSLMQYNKDAEAFTRRHAGKADARYMPHIRIGAGLNSGRATVGFMGSFDKMEFTSIGDAVNLASRTEASNKPCGTDTLITQDTYDILKKKYIRCPENNFTILPENKAKEIVVEQIPVQFEVKGKGKQHFYGVVNMPNFDIESFFSDDPLFMLDEDCKKAAGPYGPKTLSELRALLGIPEPEFEKVNLDEEENKIQVASGR